MNARWRAELIAWAKGAVYAAPIVGCLAVAEVATGWVSVLGWVGVFGGTALLFGFGLRAMVAVWREDEEENSRGAS